MDCARKKTFLTYAKGDYLVGWFIYKPYHYAFILKWK